MQFPHRLHPPLDPLLSRSASRPWRWLRRSLRALSPQERRQLTDAQVAATRPIVSGVLLAGATLLALTGMFEAAGVIPGIGYPWWLVELVALVVAGGALAIWQLDDWRPRLGLTLVSTLLIGVFMSVPLAGTTAPLALRVALFQLLPLAMLVLLARPLSIAAMVAAILGLAALRVALHGDPDSGSALYWLYTLTTIGFGLLLGGYLTDFAVHSFRLRLRLQQQATTDALTGLLNRAGWNRCVAALHDEAVARGAPTSVAFFDIDHFKRVNDRFGHALGDRTLQALGRILKERVGADGCAARLGGEEFVVLSIEQPPDAIEGFVRRVRAEFERAAADVGATVSVGIAHRQAGESIEPLLRRADAALYEAKSAGRDRLVVARG